MMFTTQVILFVNHLLLSIQRVFSSRIMKYFQGYIYDGYAVSDHHQMNGICYHVEFEEILIFWDGNIFWQKF